MRFVCELVVISGALLAAGLAGCEEDYPLPPSTQATSAPTLAPPEPACEPRHGGQLLAIGDESGYVEWDVKAGRLYWLDRACQPMAGVTDVVVYMNAPAGPRRVALTDCRGKAYGGLCLSQPPDSGLLSDSDSTGVLRFTLNGEGYRGLLKHEPDTIQPGAMTPPTPLPPGP